MCGVVLLAVLTAVAGLDARAETTVFLGLLSVAAIAYLVVLYLVGRQPPESSRALAACLLLGLVWRVVLVSGAPLVSDDVYRYIWDGRVQRFGHNPYVTVPDDPTLAHLHTEHTALIDPTSARLPTIYPPAAQLFFRAVTALHESVRMMVAAVVISDLLTALVLWRWLVYQRRSAWWVLAYAWNPLLALEGAGGGHIDVVGTLLLVTAAYALSRRRSAVAALALAGSFSVKFLPVVLLPLFWDRVRRRDIALAVAAVVFVYLPFSDGLRPPLGSLLVYAEQWRFNGPPFAWLESVVGTVGALTFAVGGGLAAAVLARRWLPREAPEAWAWPMATTLLLMPAVYPWYLVWLTPFLTTHATWPLAVWSPRVTQHLRGVGIAAEWPRVGSCRAGCSWASTAWSGRRRWASGSWRVSAGAEVLPRTPTGRRHGAAVSLSDQSYRRNVMRVVPSCASAEASGGAVLRDDTENGPISFRLVRPDHVTVTVDEVLAVPVEDARHT